jgi:hypothetical protein
LVECGIKANPMKAVERVARQKTPEEIEALGLGEIPDHGQDEAETKLGHLCEIQADEVYSVLELKKSSSRQIRGLKKRC